MERPAIKSPAWVECWMMQHVARIQHEIKLAIQQSEEFAEKSPYPAAEELYTNVYAN